MKKLIVALIIFSLPFLFSFHKSFAQTVSTSSAIPKVDYALPYPGLLPDNPLYYLKAIRDNIMKILIFDPKDKASFDLLQSDKRLEAARVLLERGNKDLALTTLSKSGNYFDDGVAKIYQAKQKGEDIRELLDKMINSSIKHQEVIRNMETGKRGDLLTSLKFEEARTYNFEQKLIIIKTD